MRETNRNPDVFPYIKINKNNRSKSHAENESTEDSGHRVTAVRNLAERCFGSRTSPTTRQRLFPRQGRRHHPEDDPRGEDRLHRRHPPTHSRPSTTTPDRHLPV